MSVIDSRVVEMKFDNKDFERNAQESLKTLSQLKNSVDKGLDGKNLAGLSKAAQGLDLSHVSNSLDQVSNRFSTLGVIGTTVLVRLTNAALDAGKKLANALISPITEKGFSRALNIENAKFQLEGLGVAWESIKNDIDYGVKDTAYGLDAAAKAAAQLVASGVKVGDSMATTLRSISGVAAMTNSTYEEISPIFTTVAGQGKLMTMQLRQLENRGLNAAATIGKHLGKTEAEVRDMVTKGKINFEIFAEAMDSAFGEHAKAANKTFTGSMANMKSALGRIGASFYSPAMEAGISIFNRMRVIFNQVHKSLDPMIKDFEGITAAVRVAFASFNESESIGKSIANVVMGLWNVLKAGLSIIHAIGTALFTAFGGNTGISKGIFSITSAFERLTAKLVPSQRTIKGIAILFKGLFDILLVVPKAIIGIISKITGLSFGFDKVGGSLSFVVQAIGMALSAFSEFILKNQILEKVLSGIGMVLGGVVVAIGSFARFIGSMISEFLKLEAVQKVIFSIASVLKTAGTAIAGFISKIVNGISAFIKSFNKLSASMPNLSFFDKLQISLRGFSDILGPISDKITSFFNIFKKGSDGIKAEAEGLEFQVTKTSNTLTRSMGFKEAIASGETTLDKIKNIFIGIKDAIVENLTIGKVVALAFGVTMIKTLRKLKSATSGVRAIPSLLFNIGYALKQNARASIIKSVATSIGILAGSLFLLSRIDAGKLKQATIALVAVLGVLGAAVTAVGLLSLKFADLGLNNDLLKLPAIMIAVSVAAGILAGVLWKLQEMSVGDAMKNVIKVGALMGVLAGVMILMSRFKVSVSFGSISVIAFAAAVHLMVGSLIKLNNKDIDTSIKTVAKVVLLLGALSAVSGGITIGNGIGFLLLVAGLSIIANSLDKLKIHIDDISDKGMIVLGGLTALVVIVRGIVSIASVLKTIAAPRNVVNYAKVGVTLLGIGATLIGISQLIKTLQSIDWSRDSVKIIAGLSATLIGIIALVSVLHGKQMQGIFGNDSAKTIASITAMLLSLSISMKILSTLKFDSWANFGAFVAGWMLMIGGLVAIITAATKIKPQALQGLTGIVMGLVAIVAEMMIMSVIPWKSLVAPIIGISAVLISFGVMMALMSKILNGRNIKTNRVIALLEIVGIIAAIGLSLNALKNANPASLIVAIAGYTIILYSLYTLIENLDKIGNVAKRATAKLQAILAVGAMIALIGLSLAPLAHCPWQQIGAACLAAIVALGACVGVVAILSHINMDIKNSIGALVALGAVAGTMIAISLGLKALASVPANNLMAAAKAMAIVTGVLGGVVAIIGVIGGVTGGMAAVAIAAFAGALLAASISMVAAGVMLRLIAAAFDVFIIAVGRLNDILPILGPVIVQFARDLNGINLLALAGGVLALSIAFGALGAAGLVLNIGIGGLMGLSMALIGLTPSLEALANVGLLGLSGQLVIFSAAMGLVSLLAAGMLGASMAFISLGAALNIFAPAIQKIENIKLTAIAVGLAAFGAATALVGALSPLIIAASSALMIFSGAMMAVGGAIAATLKSLQLVRQFVQGLMSEAQKMVTIGKNFVQGFINGIKSMASGVLNAAKEAASGAVNAIKNFLGIHSPSAVLKAIGEFFGLGFADGIDATKSLGENSASLLGDSTVGALVSSLSNSGGIDSAIAMIRDKIASLGMDVSWLDSLLEYLRKKNVRFTKVAAGHENNWRALTKAAKDSGVEFDKYGARVDKNTKITKQATEETNLFAEALAGVGGGGGVGGAAKSASESVKDLSMSIYDSIESAMSPFDKLELKTEMTKDTLLKNMQSQLDGIATWSSKLASLSEKGVSEGLLRYLAELGPQGYEYVNAFSTMTLEEIQRANQMYTAQLAMPAAATTQIKGSFEKAGIDVGDGFLKAMKEKGIQWQAEGNKMGVDTIASINIGLGNASPSHKTREAGLNLIQGLVQGLNNNYSLVLSKVTMICTLTIGRFRSELTQSKFIDIGRGVMNGLIGGINNRANDLFKLASNIGKIVYEKFLDELKPSKFEEIGKQICNGLKKGIEDNAGQIKDAARNAARSAYEAALKELEVKSPSRKMQYIGEMYDAGLAKGITDNTTIIDTAAQSAANTAIDSMRQIIDDIYTGLSSGFDFNPVITPRLDLSNIQAGAVQMQNMLNSREVALRNLSGSLSGDISNTGHEGNSVSYVQNIYAPKSPSRVELYRDTKNLISMSKRRMVAAT